MDEAGDCGVEVEPGWGVWDDGWGCDGCWTRGRRSWWWSEAGDGWKAAAEGTVGPVVVDDWRVITAAIQSGRLDRSKDKALNGAAVQDRTGETGGDARR